MYIEGLRDVIEHLQRAMPRTSPARSRSRSSRQTSRRRNDADGSCKRYLRRHRNTQHCKSMGPHMVHTSHRSTRGPPEGGSWGYFRPRQSHTLKEGSILDGLVQPVQQSVDHLLKEVDAGAQRGQHWRPARATPDRLIKCFTAPRANI